MIDWYLKGESHRVALQMSVFSEKTDVGLLFCYALFSVIDVLPFDRTVF